MLMKNYFGKYIIRLGYDYSFIYTKNDQKRAQIQITNVLYILQSLTSFMNSHKLNHIGMY